MDPVALDEGRPAQRIADPQASVIRRCQGEDVVRPKPHVAAPLDSLETQAVESKESAGGSEPEISVGRLGDRGDLPGAAVLEGPRGVVKLPQTPIQIQGARFRTRQEGDEASQQHDGGSKPH